MYEYRRELNPDDEILSDIQGCEKTVSDMYSEGRAEGLSLFQTGLLVPN